MASRAGSPNKNKQALIALLQHQYPGYQPVMEIAKAAFALTNKAIEADESGDPDKEAANLWKEAGTQHEKVAQYVTPKLKAVTVTGADGGAVQHSLVVEYVDPDSKRI